MKTKTIDALEQALADMGGGMTPKQPDEFTVAEMSKAAGGVQRHTIQRKLFALVESGAYTRRRLGKDFLYRKVDTRAKTR